MVADECGEVSGDELPDAVHAHGSGQRKIRRNRPPATSIS